MERIVVLKYCYQLLTKWESADPVHAWFWAIRRKAAAFCISLETHSGRVPEQESLTADEKRMIEATHPLLQRKTARAEDDRLLMSSEWRDKLRIRVQFYLDSLSGPGG